MLFMQACKALPGTQLSVGYSHPANGNIWLAGNPGSSLCWDAYNHFMPPNGTSCAALNDPNVNPGGAGGTGLGTTSEAGARSWTPFLRAAITPAASISASPTGRSGSSRTGHLPNLVVVRHPQRQRGLELRCLLIGHRPGEVSGLSGRPISFASGGRVTTIEYVSPTRNGLSRYL